MYPEKWNVTFRFITTLFPRVFLSYLTKTTNHHRKGKHMKLFFSFFPLLLVAVLLTAPAGYSIEPNQWDNFQGGTTQNWTSGAVNPNPPVIVLTGGPAGAGDAYLLVTSTGNQGAGGRMAVFNQSQWTGNYISAGVTVVSLHMNNFSTETLNMRIVMRGAGGDFWSASPVVLSAQSGWQIVQFSLSAADLTGGVNLTNTLSNVTEVRFIHSVAGGYQGDIINATLGVDNITAADTPLPVELISFTANQSGNSVLLSWITASEINNSGFDIERKLYADNAVWEKIGFVTGHGTTTEAQTYSFVDNQISTGKYYFRLRQIDFNGTFAYSSIVEVDINILTDFVVKQNYPNPFNPSTKISWQQPEQGLTRLAIFDILGNEVAVLVNETTPAGTNEAVFNAAGFSSGVYFYKLQSGSFSEVKKMMLIR